MPENGTGLDRPHVFLPGLADDSPVLIALHETGGSEVRFADFARSLHPEAAVLSPRGLVLEGPHLRWFRRLSEGVFDVDDVEEQADRLAEFVSMALDAYGLIGRPVIAAGFSNGANIGLALAMRHPTLLRAVVAFSGMYPFADRSVRVPWKSLSVLLLNADADAMAPPESVSRLEQQLIGNGAHVSRLGRLGGHGILASEIGDARVWLSSLAAGSIH